MEEKTKINRRKFITISGIAGGALVLGYALLKETKLGELVNMSGVDAGSEFTPYIIIDRSGKITLMNPKAEMGQGTYQSVPALIAEELEVSLDQVTVKLTSGEAKFPDDQQMTGGSSSVNTNYLPLRTAGAAAKEMLVKAASEKWGAPVTECYAANAMVHHKPSGKSISYGDLAERASKLPVPKKPALKDPKDFRILGKSSPRNDIPLKVKGKAVFGIDADVPGMVYASIERCPVLGSKLVSFDDSDTLKIKGVTQVVKTDRIFFKNHYMGLAVIAENYWAALQGRKALKVTWDNQGLDKFNSKDYEQSLRELSKTEGLTAHKDGDFDSGYANAAKKIEALYETPFVSHSPMEPMNCTAEWKDGKIEVWVSSQGAAWTRDEIAKALSIPKENVKVNMLFSGGGFGRRISQDFAVEAASIAKAINKPVKLIWTREDDTSLGPFRPPTFSAMKGGLSGDGKAVAFQHKVVSPSINATIMDKFDKSKVDEDMVEGISIQPYEIPNVRNAYVYSEIHLPLTWWRSVTASTVSFAHESFIDEMAVAAGKDPMAFRLGMLNKPSDSKKVLMKLKEVSHWDTPLPAGKARGVAQWNFFAGLCGHVVEVSRRKDNSVKVDKVYSVIDLGTVVNPDNVRSQVEGGIAMALTAATKDAITFENGKAVQSNFHNNRMLRIDEMPEIEVHILADGGPVIKGVGEPGLPPLAPALCNAVFALTGKRVRKLPFDLNNV
ncbi:xanthine dehydrogenase family protein molybdopterin-binding subunit [Mucilaginibacter sp.]|jgi:isoquinoline 1-oxidoreductase beta subunit|uniref:xanthine dehydrogenase family protein molybdopterin-binding subunit n=1 Tax=Mucilaginibacter sp. TaxID=1882438 RepID=UPI002BAD5AF1|nr:xanthine dehydrogenase family protein molybdopterin-binding subunit [Mucilaginibacter sp.]HTI57919.1 xanthine dehydrogenase family protein molybdopterin-binding subunit [Mucilaginibacter sp.]